MINIIYSRCKNKDVAWSGTINKLSQALKDSHQINEFFFKLNFFQKVIIKMMRFFRKNYLIEKLLLKFDINHGIYMDIFPLDGFPKEKHRQI